MGQLPLDAELFALFEKVRRRLGGEVASSIPALAKADPDWFGVSLVTVDGGSHHLGDSEQPFTIQSVSKPFVFGLALDEHGVGATLQRVGVEPSGDPFNAIELDLKTHRPFNPMVTTGAIVTTSLVKGQTQQDRTESILRGLSRFAGRGLDIDDDVFASERETWDRNFAIGYLLRNFGMLDADVHDVVEAYFKQCSVLVNAQDLALMGATLANRGVNPLTGKRTLREENVARVLSVMSTCGMYDYAGEWVFRVGLPAKSGVSGAVVAVLPGEFGLAVFSPPLDEHGNSVRGIAFTEELSARFGVHLMGTTPTARRVVRRTYRGDMVRSKRVRTAAENAVLRNHGSATHVIEVQGDLGFGATEALARVVQAELDGTSRLVIDFRRVGAVEPAVAQQLRAMADLVARAGADLVLAGFAAVAVGSRGRPRVRRRRLCPGVVRGPGAGGVRARRRSSGRAVRGGAPRRPRRGDRRPHRGRGQADRPRTGRAGVRRGRARRQHPPRAGRTRRRAAPARPGHGARLVPGTWLGLRGDRVAVRRGPFRHVRRGDGDRVPGHRLGPAALDLRGAP